jgi:hypothetical protein
MSQLLDVLEACCLCTLNETRAVTSGNNTANLFEADFVAKSDGAASDSRFYNQTHLKSAAKFLADPQVQKAVGLLHPRIFDSNLEDVRRFHRVLVIAADIEREAGNVNDENSKSNTDNSNLYARLLESQFTDRSTNITSVGPVCSLAEATKLSVDDPHGMAGNLKNSDFPYFSLPGGESAEKIRVVEEGKDPDSSASDSSASVSTVVARILTDLDILVPGKHDDNIVLKPEFVLTKRALEQSLAQSVTYLFEPTVLEGIGQRNLKSSSHSNSHSDNNYHQGEGEGHRGKNKKNKDNNEFYVRETTREGGGGKKKVRLIGDDNVDSAGSAAEEGDDGDAAEEQKI